MCDLLLSWIFMSKLDFEKFVITIFFLHEGSTFWVVFTVRKTNDNSSTLGIFYKKQINFVSSCTSRGCRKYLLKIRKKMSKLNTCRN
jgi:hypothetical protein